jgi:hypothetical protein
MVSPCVGKPKAQLVKKRRRRKGERGLYKEEGRRKEKEESYDA